MKQKDVCKKIIIGFLLIAIIFPLFTQGIDSVYGKVNGEYSNEEISATIDLEDAVKNSTLIEYIARFIYVIAGWLEKMVVYLISYFTGIKSFPWADRVIFNTVPFLDVNFLSPSAGSMFLSEDGTTATIFGQIVGNIYYTIFILAMSFFGVVVGVMAIRLATSSIAAEKAKYKSAIQNWLIALLLLFTTHYLISFIFYVNEKMVEVASVLLKDRVEDVDFSIDVTGWSDDTCANMVKLLEKNIGQAGRRDFYVKSKDGKIIIYAFVHSNYNENTEYPVLVTQDEKIGKIWDKKILNEDEYTYIENLMKEEKENPSDLTKKFNKNVCLLLTTPSYMKSKDFDDYATSINFFGSIANGFTGNSDENIQNIFVDAAYLTAEEISLNKSSTEYSITSNEFKENTKNFELHNGDYKYSEVLYNIYESNVKGRGALSQKKDIFTNMSDFFRNSVYDFKRDKNGKIQSTTATEFAPIPAILYSIFVIQSIMFFISYIKRFFYIIVLALFAPFVILYDFLMKTISA